MLKIANEDCGIPSLRKSESSEYESRSGDPTPFKKQKRKDCQYD